MLKAKWRSSTADTHTQTNWHSLHTRLCVDVNIRDAIEKSISDCSLSVIDGWSVNQVMKIPTQGPTYLFDEAIRCWLACAFMSARCQSPEVFIIREKKGDSSTMIEIVRWTARNRLFSFSLLHCYDSLEKRRARKVTTMTCLEWFFSLSEDSHLSPRQLVRNTQGISMLCMCTTCRRTTHQQLSIQNATIPKAKRVWY